MCLDVSASLLTMSPVAPSSPTEQPSNRLVVMKPRLTRRLTRSAKINLNKYWNMFEDLMVEKKPSRSRDFVDVDMNNEINDNINNEKREVQGSSEGSEGRCSRCGCRCECCLVTRLRGISVTEPAPEAEVTHL